ncbi:hypothetical protein C5167_048839 [Papaver somniferum]|uniref:CDT1 Geminin-binding domain-containing protein n=1 Tax=Papaver somniferum TaxID=3469 RepID=A0A4Y7KKF1_PAPSO|nr:CDT1-like protein a, chloroplastic [Papaver somniferum]RZC73356.1 hypothetical protein C5167_048839 [Papaver somniferum]
MKKASAPSSISESFRQKKIRSVKDLKEYMMASKSKKEEESSSMNPVTPVSKPKKKNPITLPEKYELLIDFYKSMEKSIRLLRMRRTMTTFTNVSRSVESLTKRRFTIANLAQIKYLLPEEIVLERVTIQQDELTQFKKSDFLISLPQNYEPGKGFSSLEKVFRSRLKDFMKSHPQDDDVPEGILPRLFNPTKEDNTREAANLVAASVLPSSFKSRFSAKAPILESEKTDLLSIPLKPSTSKAPETSALCEISKEESPFSAIPSPLRYSSKLPITINSTNSVKTPPPSPLAASVGIKSKEIEDCYSKDVGVFEITPAKVISTPSRVMMTVTPDLPTPKRERKIHQEDDSVESPSKLLRRPPRNRSLLFNTPVKKANPMEKINEEASSSTGLNNLLGTELVQLIKENEKRVMEEQDSDLSRAKLRKRMIARLPKMFDMVHLIFNSMKRSVATKEEVIQKITANHIDVIDRRETEEQLALLKELLPEWISEVVASSGDTLLRINKLRSTDELRKTLDQAV